ncbi:alanine racemase [Desulfurivibrio sp. C05AmB]|uniref:alanine racemase n=1 Tax=Desulfurivibrio sp. C05AmB TaxID=3374371 RepID=UPI00376F3D66
MSAASYNSVMVDLDALRDNFRAVSQRVSPATRVMAVVKADAYGHGLAAAAGAFTRAGAQCFGVAEAEEGVCLREAGIQGEIVLLLGLDPAATSATVAHDLSPVVFDRAGLAELSRQALGRGKVVAVHLKLDVGMGRFGLPPAEAGRLLEAIRALPGLRLGGIMAHFPLADDPEAERECREHWRRFSAAASAWRDGWAEAGRIRLHMANSAALFRFPWAHGDLVRPGISLYGYPPADPAPFLPPALRPAMSLRSRILQVKELPAGCGISYGHRFVTSRPTRLAVLPLGYADGYPRGVSGRAQVLIGGRRVPLCGTICMNACMADVSAISGVAAGAEVIFMGRQGDEFIGAAEIAAWHETISYEILCRFGAMNKRLYSSPDGEPEPA